jgi:hypothetical protein
LFCIQHMEEERYAEDKDATVCAWLVTYVFSKVYAKIMQPRAGRCCGVFDCAFARLSVCWLCALCPSDLEQSTVTSGTTQQAKQALIVASLDTNRMRHSTASTTVCTRRTVRPICLRCKPVQPADRRTEAAREKLHRWPHKGHTWCFWRLCFPLKWCRALRSTSFLVPARPVCTALLSSAACIIHKQTCSNLKADSAMQRQCVRQLVCPALFARWCCSSRAALPAVALVFAARWKESRASFSSGCLLRELAESSAHGRCFRCVHTIADD